jgi:hypothetical protein
MMFHNSSLGRMARFPRRQGGIALVVMLFMLVIILISSLYLLKSSSTATTLSSNLAYDSELSKSTDLALLTGFKWLKDIAAQDKQHLNADDATNGYRSTLDTSQAVSSSGFWTGSVTIITTDERKDRIEYVIHRMCSLTGAYDGTNNKCMQTTPNTSTVDNSVEVGTSLASDSTPMAGSPEVHYVITARILGTRGGNVVNQLVVMIGA